MTPDQMKKAAAIEALKFVKPGMNIGLGTGSTANHFIEALGARVKEGLDVRGVPTSKATEDLAREHGIPLVRLHDYPHLDLTVDGADEFDPEFRLIKGGGGALLREKIVASSSRFMVVIADESKRVKKLGKFPLPVEVVVFGIKATIWKIERAFKFLKLDVKMVLRVKDGNPFVTENGNFILDCSIGEIPDPARLEGLLKSIPGVVETGLFIGICGIVLMGTPKGVTEFKRG
ncbi:MAG TPA: ribose-5-phosphate isomerase RpiA [Aestuariivirga sp.]|nr:ribose-5-phosphate isomerase RpiA [Aestuariivirga sp.]